MSLNLGTILVAGAAEGPGRTVLRIGDRVMSYVGDDIFLDLVAAAVDRRLAPVEIARRDGGGVVGADRFFVPAIFERFADERMGVVADRLEQEFGDRLLDFGAAKFQQRRSGCLKWCCQKGWRSSPFMTVPI